MALRLLVYQGLLYQDLIKSGDILEDGRLPPILPIVLYNGQPRWTAADDIADLIPTVPGLVGQFKLNGTPKNPTFVVILRCEQKLFLTYHLYARRTIYLRLVCLRNLNF